MKKRKPNAYERECFYLGDPAEFGEKRTLRKL